ncbi:AAA family ATPase [Algoriphagus antarcticus]|jgi:NadR type nicotinamide-nucleotide adenylyltransferase|uniref:NadR type nicotinamide-nucleotide adenylyltransferase n=1 Tax=Algoriphagus antarcticus TaxID=238540 RepID=A0A3E0DUI8_9BACT|nr:ATP-binding protein [Algoriphagus antarcticus]REG87056.1 NadR type nicotinamide-nucleotide adenylyltransferase [Algoriphagus antarcticus]
MSNPKRILILGPESTGKSTLAEDLAKYFGEPWVPEYAREYLENLGREYRYEDMIEIGKGQVALEDAIAENANNYLFCDTDLRVIHIWSEHRFGKTDPWVMEQIGKRTYDLILLTNTDLPWAPDPQREYPELEMRQYFFKKYLQLAKDSDFPYSIICGDRKKRLETAVEVINQLEA